MRVYEREFSTEYMIKCSHSHEIVCTFEFRTKCSSFVLINKLYWKLMPFFYLYSTVFDHKEPIEPEISIIFGISTKFWIRLRIVQMFPTTFISYRTSTLWSPSAIIEKIIFIRKALERWKYNFELAKFHFES